jgi:heat shock protein HtpX
MNSDSRKVDTIESFIRMSVTLGLFVVLLLTLLAWPLITGSFFLGGNGSWWGWFIWFISSVLFFILVLMSYLLGPWLLKRRHSLIPLSGRYPKIYSMISTLCKSRGLETPRLYFLNLEEPSAFVFGRTSNSANLAITKGAIELLDPDELNAVIQHELSHVQNKDMPFMTWGVTFLEVLKYWIVGFLISMVIYDVARTPHFSSWAALLIGEIGWFLTSLLPIALVLFVVIPVLTIYSVSRVREHLADAGAILFLGSPHPMDSALKKIMRWKVEKQIAKALMSKIPKHLSVLSFSSSKKLPSFIAKYTIATHPSQKERLDAIKTEKYLIKSDRLSFLDLETSFYTGLIVFYAFLAEAFVARLVFVPNLVLFSLPIFVALFINLNTLRYPDSKFVSTLPFKKWLRYVLGLIAGNIVSCASFLAFVGIFNYVLAFEVPGLMSLAIVLVFTLVILSTLLIFLSQLVKNIIAMLKK